MDLGKGVESSSHVHELDKKGGWGVLTGSWERDIPAPVPEVAPIGNLTQVTLWWSLAARGMDCGAQ